MAAIPKIKDLHVKCVKEENCHARLKLPEIAAILNLLYQEQSRVFFSRFFVENFLLLLFASLLV